MPIDGGKPTQVVDDYAGWGTMDISSDGRLLPEAPNRGQFVVCDLPTCGTRREIELPANFGARPRWTPDGQRIAYIDSSGANLWTIDLEGTSPRPMTSSCSGGRPPRPLEPASAFSRIELLWCCGHLSSWLRLIPDAG